MQHENNVSGLSIVAVLLLVIGQVLPQVDFAIVNVSLDVLGKALNTDETGLVLIVALYGLSFSALITTGGRLGDKYGRKRLFMVGIVGFCIASALCGLASGIVSMLLGRVLQGVFAALLLPQILATIHATLEGERHRYVVGIYTSIGGLSAILGQVAGGWLVSANLWNLGWRVAFFINVPICIVIFIFGCLTIPETRSSDTRQSMDLGGIALFILCLLSVMVPISLGGRWHGLWWWLAATVPCAFLLWRVERGHERAGRKAILPPSMFREAMVKNGFVREMTVTFAFPGYLFVTALCLQSELGFTPLESGNAFVALGAMFFVGSLISKRLGHRLGDHLSYALGALLTVSGFLATIWLFYHFNHRLTFYDLWGATGVIGLGNAIMLTSAYRLTLSHVDRRYASEVSGALATVQQGCFALGTAFAGALYAGMLRYGGLNAVMLSIGALASLVVLVAIGLAIHVAHRR